uniref:Zn-finger protein n=1 Tax=Pithovirus LCPAC406 TaxID=2506599 RepID=A0A481ZDX5_9VIRU|nr:MAG: uncharacterized protein LCPAC406_01700 [Pithovirus LCPAC406]
MISEKILCGSLETYRGNPCRIKLTNGKCHRHDKDVIHCGSLETAKGKPCRIKLTNGECYCHGKNVILCGSLETDRKEPCKISVIILGDRCSLHSKEEKDITERRCTECKQLKSLDKFNKSNDSKYGVLPKCKECLSAITKALNYSRTTSGEKQCIKCKEFKDVKEFSSNKSRTTGLNNSCKICSNIYNKELSYPRRVVGNKTCSICGLLKHVSLFGTNKAHKSGLTSACSICLNMRRTKLESNLDIFIDVLLSHSKSSSKSKFEYDIDKQYIIDLYESQHHICPGTGYELLHSKTYNPDRLDHFSDSSYYNMSIDRRDSNLGYIKRNVQVTTWGYNMVKGELDEKYLFEVCQDITLHQERTDKSKRVKIDSLTENFIRGLHIKSQNTLNNKFKAIDIKFEDYCDRCDNQKDLCDDARERFYRRSRTVNITFKQLYNIYENQGGLCKLSGKLLTINTSTRLRPTFGRKLRREENYGNISIDRIDSLGDYTIDNVQLVTSSINMMKMSMPQTLFIQFCKAIIITHPL